MSPAIVKCLFLIFYSFTSYKQWESWRRKKGFMVDCAFFFEKYVLDDMQIYFKFWSFDKFLSIQYYPYFFWWESFLENNLFSYPLLQMIKYVKSFDNLLFIIYNINIFQISCFYDLVESLIHLYTSKTTLVLVNKKHWWQNLLNIWCW